MRRVGVGATPKASKEDSRLKNENKTLKAENKALKEANEELQKQVEALKEERIKKRGSRICHSLLIGSITAPFMTK